jgi:hypothetical protein
MSPGKWKCDWSVLVKVRSSLPIQDTNGVSLDTSFPSTSYVNRQCHAMQPIRRKRQRNISSLHDSLSYELHLIYTQIIKKKHFKSTWTTSDLYADYKDPIMYYHIQIHIDFSSSFGSAFHFTNNWADNSTADKIPRLLWNPRHSYSQKLTLLSQARRIGPYSSTLFLYGQL